MKPYHALGLAVLATVGITACQPTSPDLAQLVREKGTLMVGVDGSPLPKSYSLTSSISDGNYQHSVRIEVRDCATKAPNGEIIGRMEIRVDPITDADYSHLPFGYEITDWGCDGMNENMDDFRIYLGNDRWHSTSPEARAWNPLFERVARAAVIPMYEELVRTLYESLQ